MIKKEVMKRIVMISIVLIFSALSVFYLRPDESSSFKTDLVVFSYNRPLQLYAFLESAEKYLSGVGEKHVVYRASQQEFDVGYEVVKNSFASVHFHQQGAEPEKDFMPVTLKASFESPAQYIIYAVDDIIVKDYVDLAFCAEALEKYNAYAFFLRLGKNTTYCYSMCTNQGNPPLQKEGADIFSWSFNQGRADWAYPNNVDMTVYRKKEIEPMLKAYSYHQPNLMEDRFMRSARIIFRKKGLCFAESKIVNVPLNIVQTQCPNNPAMHEFTVAELLEKFNNGLKIDINPLYKFANKSAHMDYSPSFVTR